MKCNQYNTTTLRASVPAEKHPIMLPSNNSSPPCSPLPESLPIFFHRSICSLAPCFQQRTIWTWLPASSGEPLHKEDSFSSTSVSRIKDGSVYPFNLLSYFIFHHLFPTPSPSVSDCLVHYFLLSIH